MELILSEYNITIWIVRPFSKTINDYRQYFRIKILFIDNFPILTLLYNHKRFFIRIKNPPALLSVIVLRFSTQTYHSVGNRFFYCKFHNSTFVYFLIFDSPSILSVLLALLPLLVPVGDLVPLAPCFATLVSRSSFSGAFDDFFRPLTLIGVGSSDNSRLAALFSCSSASLVNLASVTFSSSKLCLSNPTIELYPSNVARLIRLP